MITNSDLSVVPQGAARTLLDVAGADTCERVAHRLSTGSLDRIRRFRIDANRRHFFLRRVYRLQRYLALFTMRALPLTLTTAVAYVNTRVRRSRIDYLCIKHKCGLKRYMEFLVFFRLALCAA